jgi:hypothetical protein
MSAVTPATQPAASQQAAVEAALVLLERMGLSPADLVAAPRDRAVVPTFAEYVPGGVGGGNRRDPPGLRFLLEPDHRALGRPAAGRADPVRHPAADGLRQDARGDPPQRAGRPQRTGAPGGRAALPVPARSRTD